jgi:hypothetical protein
MVPSRNFGLVNLDFLVLISLGVFWRIPSADVSPEVKSENPGACLVRFMDHGTFAGAAKATQPARAFLHLMGVQPQPPAVIAALSSLPITGLIPVVDWRPDR